MAKPNISLTNNGILHLLASDRDDAFAEIFESSLNDVLKARIVFAQI